MTPIIEIARDAKFEAAHWLPNVPPGHRCANLHGHTYRLTVICQGPLLEDKGWVADFGDLKDALAPLIKTLDHHLLNDYVTNPTCENMLIWLWDKISLPGLVEIRLRETDTSWATYRGEATP